MSQENVNAVRASFEAFGRGDFAAVLETMDPSVEWIDPESVPWGGAHRGHDAFGEHMQRFAGHFEEFRLEPVEFLDAGEQVVVLGRFVGRGARGDFDVPFAQVWDLAGGKAVRVETFTDTASVLQAL